MSPSSEGSRSSEGVKVNMEDLRKKLGMGGYHIWTLMVKCQRKGLVTLSTAEMRRARGLTADQAKKGLLRLREAKLVRSLGWRRLEVQQTYGPSRRARVFARQVRGSILAPDKALVPVATWQWLKQAKAWGGARKGAGKRVRQTGCAQEGQFFQEAPSSVSRGPERGGLGFPRRGNPLGGTSLIHNRDIVLDLTSFNLKLVRGDRLAPTVSVSELDSTAEPDQAGGAGNDQPEDITAQDLYRHPSVPPRPRIRTPAVPPPPQLTPGASPLEHAKILARLYTTALEKRYSKRIWAFSKGVERSRYRKLLESTAAILLEKEIPPGQWVRWRLSQALDQTQHWKGKPPPVNTIYSTKAITKDRWKYRAFGEDATLSAHRLVPGKILAKLELRWWAMDRALLREVPLKGIEAVPVIVARFFPAGLYDQLTEAATAESAELSNLLRQRAKSGEYLW